jgi:hypothetical protein
MIAAMTGTNMKPRIPAMRVTMLLQLNLENSMFSKTNPEHLSRMRRVTTGCKFILFRSGQVYKIFKETAR